MAKLYNTSIICLAQAVGEAENRKYLKLSDIYGSRVGIQGELDYAIGIGRTMDDLAYANVRFINIPKNKLNEGDTAKFNVEQDWTKAQTFTPVAISSSSGALAVDTDLHQVATCTLSENTTVSSATNQKNGRIITLVFTGASTYTLAWNANYKRRLS